MAASGFSVGRCGSQLLGGPTNPRVHVAFMFLIDAGISAMAKAVAIAEVSDAD